MVLKIEIVLKWRDVCIANPITVLVLSLMAGLKLEGIVEWRGLKSQGPLYICIMYRNYLGCDILKLLHLTIVRF